MNVLGTIKISLQFNCFTVESNTEGFVLDQEGDLKANSRISLKKIKKMRKDLQNQHLQEIYPNFKRMQNQKLREEDTNKTQMPGQNSRFASFDSELIQSRIPSLTASDKWLMKGEGTRIPFNLFAVEVNKDWVIELDGDEASENSEVEECDNEENKQEEMELFDQQDHTENGSITEALDKKVESDGYNYGIPVISTKLVDFKGLSKGKPSKKKRISLRFVSIATVVHYHPDTPANLIPKHVTGYFNSTHAKARNKHFANQKRKRAEKILKGVDPFQNQNFAEEKRKFKEYMKIPFENFIYDVEFTNNRKEDEEYKYFCINHRTAQKYFYFQRCNGNLCASDPALTDSFREGELSYDPSLVVNFFGSVPVPVQIRYQFINEHYTSE